MPHNADERLRTQLEQKLSSHGIRPPCKVTISVRNGVVTLSGTVQYDYQKRQAAHACRAASGVKSVVDNIQVAAHKSPWAGHENKAATAYTARTSSSSTSTSHNTAS